MEEKGKLDITQGHTCGRGSAGSHDLRGLVVLMRAQSLSCVQLFATPWTVAHQASLSMEFSRQEYWSGLLFPPPEYLPNPGIETTSPVSPALAGRFLPLSHLGSLEMGIGNL